LFEQCVETWQNFDIFKEFLVIKKKKYLIIKNLKKNCQEKNIGPHVDYWEML